MKTPYFILTFALLVSFSTFAFGEDNVVAIGTDSLKDLTYTCVRGNNPKKNRVRVTRSSSDTVRSVSRAKARKDITRSRKQAAKRLKKARKLLKKAKKQEANLLGKLILTPVKQARLDKIQERIANLDLRIAELTTNIATLKEMVRGIKDCGKDLGLNGNFQFISGTGVDALGRTIFFAGYYFIIDDWDETNEGLCVRIPNVTNPVLYTVFPPRFCLQKDPVQGSDVCFLTAADAFNGRYYVGVAFRNGIQDPGTCDPEPWRCSASEALKQLNADVDGLSYELVGVVPQSGRCL